MNESMEKQIREQNALRAGIWVAALLIFGGLVAFMVFAEVGQYYKVGRYLFWEAVALLAMLALTAIWFHLATATSGWVLTQTFLASLAFVFTAWALAALLFLVCHLVYTPDGRNFLELSAVFVLPAAFTGLMYRFPPLQIEQEILPFGGVVQNVTRWLIAAIALGGIAGLFWYNF